MSPPSCDPPQALARGDRRGVSRRLVVARPLPSSASRNVGSRRGECLLFVDGLRYDLGVRLTRPARGRGLRVELGSRWAALPTVTATAKPAVTPVADLVSGEALGGLRSVLLPPASPPMRRTSRGASRAWLPDPRRRRVRLAPGAGWQGAGLEFGEHRRAGPQGRRANSPAASTRARPPGRAHRQPAGGSAGSVSAS